MKALKILVVILFCSAKLFAQDAVLISEGNFERGVIKASNFNFVAIMNDEQKMKEFDAKDVQSYMWNGVTYISKPVVIKKKIEFRFFKLIESGVVNLYVFGDNEFSELLTQQLVKVRPTIGFGVGSGGVGGGIGGGVTFGGKRISEAQTYNAPRIKVAYFIEKPGTGPMQEVNLDNTNAVKNILLQKLTNDDDLAESIKATEAFDAKNLAAYVKAYNTERN
ncbi:MAG: hypothetical protein K2P75_01730 [Sphingobacteriaceae bacterium]|nr:hypothetical protein [Sphingobacteriaceae bacterium]